MLKRHVEQDNMPLRWIWGHKSTGTRPHQMLPDDAHRFVFSLYRNLLRRVPAPREYEPWVEFVLKGNPAEKVYYSFIASEEYKLKSRVSTLYPAGHYHSPIVDPGTVGDYVATERRTTAKEMAGIPVSLEEMATFWKRSARLIAATPFQETNNPTHRFYYNSIFPYGDAIGLRAMMADVRTRKVIEVGSGFSSACMLACADEFGLDTQFTFIDPYPERLKQLLRAEDQAKVAIVEAPVQET